MDFICLDFVCPVYRTSLKLHLTHIRGFITPVKTPQLLHTGYLVRESEYGDVLIVVGHLVCLLIFVAPISSCQFFLRFTWLQRPCLNLRG